MDSTERKYQNFLQDFLAKEESNPVLHNLQQAAAINNIFLITREVTRLFRFSEDEDKALRDLSSQAVKLFCLLEQFKTKLFEDKANEFFSQVLGADSFTLLYKLTGRQSGNQVIVKSKKGDESKFYLKTHYNGENENDLWIPQQIDLSEILVYKFLELEGIGPQAYFFFTDSVYFYIVTKDAGFDNDIQDQFVTFKEIQELTPNTEILRKNENIKNGIIKADIICRTFMISDVLENYNNFGFKQIEQKLKIIDFIPPRSKVYRQSQLYENWLLANGYDRRIQIKSILKMDQDQKILNSLPVIQQLQNVPMNIEKSLEITLEIAKQLQNIKEQEIENLKIYTRNTIKIFLEFKVRIENEYQKLIVQKNELL